MVYDEPHPCLWRCDNNQFCNWMFKATTDVNAKSVIRFEVAIRE